MSTGSIPAERYVRHTPRVLDVPLSMNTVRAVYPLIRAVILAAVVILLIMIGLPTLLAAAAAAT